MPPPAIAERSRFARVGFILCQHKALRQAEKRIRRALQISYGGTRSAAITAACRAPLEAGDLASGCHSASSSTWKGGGAPQRNRLQRRHQHADQCSLCCWCPSTQQARRHVMVRAAQHFLQSQCGPWDAQRQMPGADWPNGGWMTPMYELQAGPSLVSAAQEP